MTLDITSLSLALIGAVRTLGPTVAALGFGFLVLQSASVRGRARLMLGFRGLSGRRVSPARRAVAGTLVPLLGIVALTVSLSLEQEVRLGPNRMIEQLQGDTDGASASWILQRGSGHFMNDSRLSQALAGAVGTDPRVLPLYEQLAFVEPERQPADTALVLGLAPSAAALSPLVDTSTARCRVQEGRCALDRSQVVVDPTQYRIGTRMVIRGHEVTVAAHTRKPYGLINRVVVFADPSVLAVNGQPAPLYALVVIGPDSRARAQTLLAEAGAEGEAEVLSSDQVTTENARFWAGNGTPLVLLMITLSGIFCGVALYAARRALQERERVISATLRALGLRPGQAAQVDLLRALIATALAGLAAWPIAAAIIAFTNQGMIGFHASVTPTMVAAAVGLIVGSSVLGTVVLWARMRTASIVTALSAA